MKQQRSSFSRFWELYKMGGLPSALFSTVDDQNVQHVAYLRGLLKDKQEHNLHQIALDDLHTVVFDLETTGFSPQDGDQIISIGAAALRGTELVQDETFYSLVNPRRTIPPDIETLTSITNAMVELAPTLSSVLVEFFRFVKSRVLIAHASAHDKKFLNAALRKSSGISFSHRVLDTMMVGCKLFPDHKHYTLDDWLAYYGLDNSGRHHALSDSIMTAKLWTAMIADVRQRHQVDTLGDLYAFLGRD